MEEKKEKSPLEELLEKSNINLQLDEIEKLLSSNVIEFDFKDEKYRVSKPTFGQKKLTHKRRNEVLVNLMKESNNMFEKDLRKLLKETRNIDIDEMDNRYLTLQNQKQDKQLALGKALEEKADEKLLNIYKEEIEKIEYQQQLISFEKSQYLDTSIENQVETEIYLYLAYLLTEKLSVVEGKEPKWVRVWNSYDEFLNSYEELIDIVTYYSTIISQNEIR